MSFSLTAPKLTVVKTSKGEDKIIYAEFKVPEYNRDASFNLTKYSFRAKSENPDIDEGWIIYRNDESFLTVGKGYVIVKGKYCGICSTDLARRFLPYELPQIIGHEAVAMHQSKPVVIEINASHFARGITNESSCPFCKNGLYTQCPDRITFGINQLPGGLAPYILAPINAIVPIPDNLGLKASILTEPFAAALHAVETTPPNNGHKVAVLGPRKLGMLILAALYDYRKKYNLDFTTTAIFHKDPPPQLLYDLAKQLDAQITSVSSLLPDQKFDIIFDTTGSPEGFLQAIKLCKKILHLKSTHGREVCGLKRMSDFVVDEFSLLRFEQKSLEFSWPGDVLGKRRNPNVFVSPSVDESIVKLIKDTGRNVIVLEVAHAIEYVKKWIEQSRSGKIEDENMTKSPVPRFDLAVVGKIEEIDSIIRPINGEEFSILRPRGAILYAPHLSVRETKEMNLLEKALQEDNIQIWSTRCGNLANSLEMLSSNENITKLLEEKMISKEIKLQDIRDGFSLAASENVIKVVVDVEC
ncbi:threonine dehydrogenase [Gigaspora margarita]|uniref:Threonine dehydrogenase n=1 Tax=Gigaspora margarita TaxID=4874 RepID=A0A8H4AGL2_GIGMA|nr:threonine dehydrogenase [Gigaspora margarita]